MYICISEGVYDHKRYTGCVQLVMKKILIPRHCLDCCLPCNTAVGAHWQSRRQLWAGPNTALLLTSDPMPQPWGQLRGYAVAALPMIVDPVLQPWGCPADPASAMLWPKANSSLRVASHVP